MIFILIDMIDSTFVILVSIIYFASGFFHKEE